MGNVVTVFGVSGVGKSWMIENFTTLHAVRHVTASQLIRDMKEQLDGKPASAEDLRAGSISDNQKLLVTAFKKLQSIGHGPIVFDGHSVVDTDQKLVEIPTGVIASLSPSGIIFIHAEPILIYNRRLQDEKRIRPARTEAEIGYYQDLSLLVCRRYAEELQTPLEIIESGDGVGFAKAARAFLDLR
jgi:adenylate kinase